MTLRATTGRPPLSTAQLAVALAAAAALFHALTAPSGLFWLDAGDFAAASCELGVPHPTGFPLYTLLGKLFCLVPFGSGAFRVAVLSAALAGAITAALAVLFCGLLPAGRRSPWAWAALALSSWALWTGGVAGLAGRTPDVYALHTALTLAATCVCLRLEPRKPPGGLLALGFLIGLGLSNHAEFRLFAPVLLGVGLWRARPVSAGRVAATLAAVVAGLLPYLYLPLAARRHPYHAWGEPDSWPRFWDHVTGRTIRVAFGDEMLSTSTTRLAHAAHTLLGQAASDLGPWLVLAPLGVAALWASARRPADPTAPQPFDPGLPKRTSLFVLLALLGIDLAYCVAVNPMGLRDLQDGLTAFAILALLGAAGLAVAAGFLAKPRGGSRLGNALALVLLLAVGVDALRRAPWDALLLVPNWAAEDLGYADLLGAPEGALVLTGSEAEAASRIYLVAIGALRPDVQALHRAEISDSRLLWRRHREGPFPLAPADEAARWSTWGLGTSFDTYLARLDLIIEQALMAGRTVLWGAGSADETRGRWDFLWPGYPVYQLRSSPNDPAGRLPSPFELAPIARLTTGDPWERRWLAEYQNYLGTWYVHRGSLNPAMVAFESAHDLWPDWSAPLVNLAVMAAREGALSSAASLTEAATQRDPLNATAWLNLARYRCFLGHADGARSALDQARDVHPDSPALADVEAFIARCPPAP